ncbi:hypothetical protein [Altererythrobacter sp. Z27]|uniref:hypothetical protein n=1 Tax=Altererythrobacter sp. Z27 TaxID=3461147 RepID=UPI004043B00D
MNHVADLPLKLGMLMKATSLSRVALAQQLAVDKSLVGRWLSGAVHPTDHNLARLSSLIGDYLPGFRLADWFEDSATLAQRYGIAQESAPGEVTFPGVIGEFLSSVSEESAMRGSAYEGFWRTSRPSLLMPGELFHDYGLIRRGPSGLMEVRMGGSGLEFEGYLIPFAGNLAVYLFDRIGRSPVTVMFKGVTLPRAMVFDGILLLAALDSARTPVAFPILVERVGDLSGDAEADDQRYAEIIETMPQPLEPLPDDVLKARIYRDSGPSSAAQGGDAFLSVSISSALSRGTTGRGLHG